MAPLGTALAGSIAAFGSVSTLNRLAFAIKAFMLENAVVTVLAFAATTVIVGGFFFKLSGTSEASTLSEGAFKSYLLLFDVPGADATTDDTFVGRIVSNGLFAIGVATFAVIIGIVSDRISSSVEGLRVSNERTQAVDHTVVVNWGGAYARPMLRQLEAARREGRLKGPVVVLSSRDKADVDEEVADELRRIKPRAGLEVIARTGSPVELDDMDRVAAGTARRIVVLPGAASEEAEGSEAANDEISEATGLALALQRSVRPSPERRASVIVHAPSSYHAQISDDADGFRSYAEVSERARERERRLWARGARS